MSALEPSQHSVGDRILDGLVACARWLATVDWLSAGAFILTIGAFLGAALDSYTSLCTVGGDLAHIGQASSCPDVHGWDTRTFPLAVDMGWLGGLLATVRLARSIGIGNWRWWAVALFEALVAGTTIAGNAIHGAVLVHSSHWLDDHPLRVAALASSVPGVVAVGAGFTLSVLLSARQHARRAHHPIEQPGRRQRVTAPVILAAILAERFAPRAAGSVRLALHGSEATAIVQGAVQSDAQEPVTGPVSQPVTVTPSLHGSEASVNGHAAGHSARQDVVQAARPEPVTEPVTLTRRLTVTEAAADRSSAVQGAGQLERQLARQEPVNKGRMTAAKNRQLRRAALIVAQEPSVTGAELGRRLKVSTATGQRLLRDLADEGERAPLAVVATEGGA